MIVLSILWLGCSLVGFWADFTVFVVWIVCWLVALVLVLVCDVGFK